MTQNLVTNVELLELYDKTFGNINPNRYISNCNINASLLLNALFLSLEELVKQLKSKLDLQDGGKKKFKKTRKTNNKKKLITKQSFKHKPLNKRTIRKTMRFLKGGNSIKLITSLMLSILMILNISQYAVGVQPEYDYDVLYRLSQVEKIKDIFENKYGTCAINTALFLGSIDLDTYEKVTETIIERGHGLSYSEISEYLNSSLQTLWEWDLFSIPIRKNGTRRFLRGSTEMVTSNELSNEQIKEYVKMLKDKMNQIRENKTENVEQGILTAMIYPSYGVHHVVVIWLTSDDTLVVIDPQEFVESGIVLYSDDLSKYTQYRCKNIEEYFSQYLEYSNVKKTAILMNYHVKRQENLIELTDDNEQVKKVIEKIKQLESNEI